MRVLIQYGDFSTSKVFMIETCLFFYLFLQKNLSIKIVATWYKIINFF